MIPLTAPHSRLTSTNRRPLGHYVSVFSNAHRLHLRLFRSSVMPWSRSGTRFVMIPCVVSNKGMPWCCKACVQPREALQTTEYNFEFFAMTFWLNGLACYNVCFFLIPRVSLNSAHCRLKMFIYIKSCEILLFLTHYPDHNSIGTSTDVFFSIDI